MGKAKLMTNIGGGVEHQKLGLASLAGCFLVSLAVLVVFKPYAMDSSLNFWMKNGTPTVSMAKDIDASLSLGTTNGTQEENHMCDPVPGLCEKNSSVDINLPRNSSTNIISSTQGLKNLNNSKQSVEDLRKHEMKPEAKAICDFSDRRSNVCEMVGDIRINGNFSSIIFLTSSQASPSQGNVPWKIKPHPRKGDILALSSVTEITVAPSTDTEEAPRCTVNHSVPAIVFSTGGYTGNIFHDFTDVLIPIYITSRQYHGEVQFLVSQMLQSWIKKYPPFLKQLSRYDILNFNTDQRVHCYPHSIVGLRSHKEMSIDPLRSPNGYSMLDFCQLMRSSFSLKRERAIRLGGDQDEKPRLMIIARKWTRSFKNVGEIAQMARGIGYEVVVAEADKASDLTSFAETVNSCDVLLGVHGAGLTNLVFLPVRAIVIQVVPLGKLEGIAWGDFGGPSLDAKLRYLEYRIRVEESTLVEIFPRDHPVMRDPVSVHRQGWLAVRDAYLVKQSVRIDVERFRGVLIQALELLSV